MVDAINPNSLINNQYKPKSPAGNKTTATTTDSPINISNNIEQSVNKLTDNTKQQTAQLEQIRLQVEQGNYQIDHQQLAQQLLHEYPK